MARNLLAVLCLAVLVAAPAVSAGGRTKIAVLDLKASGVDQTLAANLTAVVVGEVSKVKLFDVISRQEIMQMLNFEEERQQLGCTDASCLAEIGGALGVEYLVTGAVGKVGDLYLVNMQLIDIGKAKVENRAKREGDSEQMLVKETGSAARELLATLLEKNKGLLLVRTREEGASIFVGESLKGVSPLGVIDVPAGPHRVKVSKTGFVDWAREIEITPKQTETIEVTLIPSKEFVAEYEAKQGKLRIGAWISSALAVACGAAALGLFLYADQSYFPSNVDPKQKDCKAQGVDCPQSLRDAVKQNGKTYDSMIYATYGLEAAFGAAAVAALVLWLVGDDPDKYEDFRRAPEASVRIGVTPARGGGVMTLYF